MLTPSSGWTPRKQGEGCTLEERELPGEPIKAFKVEGIINRFAPFPLLFCRRFRSLLHACTGAFIQSNQNKHNIYFFLF